VTSDGQQAVCGFRGRKIGALRLGEWGTQDVGFGKWKSCCSFSGDSSVTICAVAADRVTIVAEQDSGRVHVLRIEGAS
jgi:hypothetical protein